MATVPRSLFDDEVPPGFRYQPEFIGAAEEAELKREIDRLEFATFEMRGAVARRRVAFFGRTYDREAIAPEIPEFLQALRERIAGWADVSADAFAMALINEYQPGAPIGWHRDAPQYGIVAGVSLLSACRMKFRRYVRAGDRVVSAGGRRSATHEIALEPRSVYLMTEESRSAYEHHIPAVSSLRYSITFRTIRA